MVTRINTGKHSKSRCKERQKAYDEVEHQAPPEVNPGIRQIKQISTHPDIKHVFPLVCRYLQKRAWIPFPHQIDVWHAFSEGRSGLLNAPTGTGKTSAVWLPVLERIHRETHKNSKRNKKGIRVLWLTR